MASVYKLEGPEKVAVVTATVFMPIFLVHCDIGRTTKIKRSYGIHGLHPLNPVDLLSFANSFGLINKSMSPNFSQATDGGMEPVRFCPFQLCQRRNVTSRVIETMCKF